MKKILVSLTVIVIFSVVSIFNTNQVRSNINDSKVLLKSNTSIAYCPNGCVDNGNGCYCNDWYPCLKEYNWDEEHDEEQ